jgi:hypothetical protein
MNKKYVVGTTIHCPSHTHLTGRIVELMGDSYQVEWTDNTNLPQEPWINTWTDENFALDSGKVLTMPIFLPEDLFVL